MVQHGVNGFIFDPCNAEELASYMGRFISEPDLISRFGAKSSEAIAPYTPERAAAVFARVALNLSSQDPMKPCDDIRGMISHEPALSGRAE
jgi:hypothetical protein